MKTLICGDTHIGAVFGLGKSNGLGGNTRVDDYEKSLNFVIDYAIKNSIDIFVQTGDLFEVRNPSVEHIHIADRAIKKLSDAGIYTIILMGNHDYKKTGETHTSALTTLQANSYRNVRILISPEIIKYQTTSTDDSVSLLLIPYRDRRMYSTTSIKEATDLFNLHIEELSSKLNKNEKNIAVGHNFYFDRDYFDFGGHELLAKQSSFKNIDTVFMGHQHDFKIFKKENPACYYVGSLERTNFGDANIKKYFLIHDSITSEVSKVEIPVRDLEDLSINLTNSTPFTYIDDYKNQVSKYNLQDKICRVKISIKDGMQNLFSKSEIEKTLYMLGAFFVSKILWDVEQIKLEKDKDILLNKDDYSIFAAFAKTQNIEESFLNKILEEAKRIMI